MPPDLNQKSTVNLITEIETLSAKGKANVYGDWNSNALRLAGKHEQEINELLIQGGKYKARRGGRGKAMRQVFASILNISHRRLLSYISRLLDAGRKFQVMAASTDKDDSAKAKACDRMLETRMSEFGGRDVHQYFIVLSLMRCCDIAFMLIEGDPTAYRPIIVSEGKKIMQGEVILKAMSAWDVSWFPGVSPLSSPAITTCERFTETEAERRWGPLPGDTMPAKWNAQSPFNTMEPNIEESLILIKRLFMAPSKQFPNGVQRIQTGTNTVLKTTRGEGEKGPKTTKKDVKPADEWLGTPDNQYPFAVFRSVPLNETSVGHGGSLKVIQSLQHVLSIAWTKTVAVMTDVPGGLFTYPSHGGLTDEDFTNVLGVAVLATQNIGGQKVEYVGGPDIRPYLELVSFCVTMIDDMMGQPEASRGILPGPRTSGKAVIAAGQMAAQTDAPDVLSVRLASADAQKRILIEGREVWPEEFVYHAIGKNREWETKEFRRADIPSSVDVRIKPDSPLPQDAQSRLKYISTMVKEQMWGDPADPKTRRKVMESLEFPVDDDEFHHEQVQRQIVRNEMTAMEKGEVAPVNREDDDTFHIQEKMSILAEQLGQGNSDFEYRRRCMVHLFLHRMSAQQKAQADQAEVPAGVMEPVLTEENLAEEQKKMIDLAVQAMEAQQAAQEAVAVAEQAKAEAIEVGENVLTGAPTGGTVPGEAPPDVGGQGPPGA